MCYFSNAGEKLPNVWAEQYLNSRPVKRRYTAILYGYNKVYTNILVYGVRIYHVYGIYSNACGAVVWDELVTSDTKKKKTP